MGKNCKSKRSRYSRQFGEYHFYCECFDVEFKLANVDGAPCLPEGSSKEECFDWIENLPFSTPPSWVGLDGDAEAKRAKMISSSVLEKGKKMSEKIKLS